MRPPASFVRAMRSIIYIVSIGLLVVASHPVSAGIPGPGGNEVPCDFVTGGGFIVGSGSPASSLPAGAKANFGVGGGVKNGAFWGHLEYNDHSTNPPIQVHGTSVTGYFQGLNGPNDRIITGTAQVNGTSGFTYRVEVNDIMEPGRDADEFTIELFNPPTVPDVYHAGFEYQDGPIQGGNIQLHKANPSNTPPPDFTCSAGP